MVYALVLRWDEEDRTEGADVVQERLTREALSNASPFLDLSFLNNLSDSAKNQFHPLAFFGGSRLILCPKIRAMLYITY